MPISRPSVPEDGGISPRPPHADPGEWARSYPKLAAVVTEASWSDGTAKRPARLSLAIYGGRWVVQCDLVGVGLTLRVEVPEPALAWDALEAALSADPVPWQPSPYVAVDPPQKGKGKGGK